MEETDLKKLLGKARYWGAEAQANNEGLNADRRYDLAVSAGCERWEDIPRELRFLLRREFNRGVQDEKAASA